MYIPYKNASQRCVNLSNDSEVSSSLFMVPSLKKKPKIVLKLVKGLKAMKIELININLNKTSSYVFS